MNTTFTKNAAIITSLLVILLWGTAGNAAAQKKGENNRQTSQKSTEAHDQRQQIYKQQQTDNQQRFDQRSKNSAHAVEKGVPSDHGSLSTYRKTDSTIKAKSGMDNWTAQTRHVSQTERKQIASQEGSWSKLQQNWQGAYDSQWSHQQNRYKGVVTLLRRQNRPEQLAFQEAYWERVNEDRFRLRDWQFVNDVALNYSYFRDGRYFYTSEFGITMLVDALNDGYQEGFLAGESDREDGWTGGFQNEFTYMDASYGYNGYWVGLDEYQRYFRLGFEQGYTDGEDGTMNRYRPGNNHATRYSLSDGSLNGIIDFNFIGR